MTKASRSSLLLRRSNRRIDSRVSIRYRFMEEAKKRRRDRTNRKESVASTGRVSGRSVGRHFWRHSVPFRFAVSRDSARARYLLHVSWKWKRRSLVQVRRRWKSRISFTVRARPPCRFGSTLRGWIRISRTKIDRRCSFRGKFIRFIEETVVLFKLNRMNKWRQ